MLAGLIGIAVLWAQYGFQFHAVGDGTDPFYRPMAAKVADLNLGHWREGIAFADRWQLLPRSYLWGLADTVRTGVEGRGITQHLVWGRLYEGRAPWFSWPAIIASKLSLALMLLALLVAGGTAGASLQFGNEGLDLGQRFDEIHAFHDDVIAPTGLPLYSSYWLPEEQLRGAGVRYRRRVESLDDTNVEGLYEGYFIYTRSSHLPMPSWDWDPAEVFAGLEKVAGFGYVEIWKGRQALPRTRASSLSGRVVDYLYKEGGQDWALVARRLEEVVALSPQSVVAGVELGNAYVRLGNGPAAVGAYRRLLEQTKVPLDPDLQRQLLVQVERMERSTDLASVTPVRNPFLE